MPYRAKVTLLPEPSRPGMCMLSSLMVKVRTLGWQQVWTTLPASQGLLAWREDWFGWHGFVWWCGIVGAVTGVSVSHPDRGWERPLSTPCCQLPGWPESTRAISLRVLGDCMLTALCSSGGRDLKNVSMATCSVTLVAVHCSSHSKVSIRFLRVVPDL